MQHPHEDLQFSESPRYHRPVSSKRYQSELLKRSSVFKRNVESCVEKTMEPSPAPGQRLFRVRLRSEPTGIGGYDVRTKSDREASNSQVANELNRDETSFVGARLFLYENAASKRGMAVSSKRNKQEAPPTGGPGGRDRLFRLQT